MGGFGYRMNRATYGVLLACLILLYILLVNTMKRPPGAEVFVALLAVPRLHDIGWSGWWLLPFLLGEVVAVAIGWSGGVEGILVAGGLYVFFCLALLIGLGFIPGQRAVNSWGEPSLAGVHFGKPGPAKRE